MTPLCGAMSKSNSLPVTAEGLHAACDPSRRYRCSTDGATCWTVMRPVRMSMWAGSSGTNSHLSRMTAGISGESSSNRVF